MYHGSISDVTNVMIGELQQIPPSKDSNFRCSNVPQTDWNGK